MMGYTTILPAILLVLYIHWPKKLLLTTSQILTLTFVVIYNMSSFGECGLYREWKSKLNMQALYHFVNPSEVFKSASLDLSILFFGLLIFFSFLYFRVYHRYIKPKTITFERKSILKNTLGILILLPLISCIWILIIRGGVKDIPIQSGDSFFCTNSIANDASVNPLWNLSFEFFSWMDHRNVNIFKTMDDSQAEAIVKDLYVTESDSTELFLTTRRPNVVFIILESWTANAVKAYGGDNFTPFYDSLCRKGIRFTNFYPAGYVSDQGIVGLLSGYPCTPRMAIINQSSKSAKIPCINEDLKPYGYQSGFVFGGDLNYGNIRSYLYNKSWDVVLEEKNFPPGLDQGALGIHDRDISKEFLKAINKSKTPFVYSWFTVSTHRPYDYKGTKKNLVPLQNDFINSLSYSDSVLREFFTMARQCSWYDSTLFILCPDHSHDSHKGYGPESPEFHKIPMFFFGNVIKPEYRGENIEKIFSQIDIVPTLLYQMDLGERAKKYVWGRNMFNPTTKPYSYFCSHDFEGMIHPRGVVSFQPEYLNFGFDTTSNTIVRDSLIKVVQAYQQMVYKDFMEK